MTGSAQDNQSWLDCGFEPQSLAPVWMPFVPGDVVVLALYAADLWHYVLLSQQAAQLDSAGGMHIRQLQV
jgi:hypothetical protein